jgi:hypothetical protein
METPSQFVLSRLSRDLYIDFLDEAKNASFHLSASKIFSGARNCQRAILCFDTILILRAFVGMDVSVQQDLADNSEARAPGPDIRVRSDDTVAPR